MDLSINEDQLQILNFLDGLSKPYEAVPIHDISFALTSDEFDQQLAESGFLDVMAEPSLGPVTAALVVERLARLPFTTEAAASALVRPLLELDGPGPVCLIEEGQLHKPVRFLRPDATVVLVGEERVRSFVAAAEHIRDAGKEILYAYPVAFLASTIDEADMVTHAIGADRVRTAWRTALAAEGAGLLAAALSSAVEHVSERKQFGRPLAAFQSLRHRLAEAHVITNGAYWLAMKAAASADEADAALAAFHVQDAVKQIAYDLHQFLGAMGMTLEHPLHLWTYRLKALSSELGGSGRQAIAAASSIWPS